MKSKLNKSLLTIIDHTEEIKKMDFFISTGHLNRKLGIVKEGVLRGFVTDEGGNEINVLLYQENDLITGNFVPNVPASINIQALENCIIGVVEFRTALMMVKDNEDLNNEFNKMVSMLHSKIQSRLTSFINFNSLDRYRFFLKDYPNLINRIPNYHIANYLGITPTQLSRIRRSFANK